MITTTVRDVLHAHAVISARGGIELPTASALKLARLTRAIRDEAEPAQMVMGQIVRRNAKLDAKGERVTQQTPMGDQFVMADQDRFEAEREQLRKQEVKLNVDPIPRAELGDGKIHSDVLDALLPFIAP